jgi:hypothetical protein
MERRLGLEQHVEESGAGSKLEEEDSIDQGSE